MRLKTLTLEQRLAVRLHAQAQDIQALVTRLDTTPTIDLYRTCKQTYRQPVSMTDSRAQLINLIMTATFGNQWATVIPA
jgi:hypothetical protein